jgi:uncharacterized protein (TIGR02588 family)
MTQKQAETVANEQAQSRSPVEWVTFGIASAILAIVVCMVGFLWLDETRKQPPDVAVVRSGNIRQATGQFYLPFSVTNSGGTTAESVQVMADLVVEGEVVESGEQQIDFLSGGETEEGAFVFTRNPQSGEVVLRIASYKLP